jgi:putative PIN family toxin of toxin-antitoxin system
MLKVVLDTNIIVSTFIKRTESTEKIINSLKQHGFKLVISEEILKEILEVLLRPNIRKLTKMNKREVRELGRLLLENAFKVEPHQRLEVSRDPADNKFLECAVTAKANYVVTGDKDLLEIKNYRGVKIITLQEFCKMI